MQKQKTFEFREFADHRPLITDHYSYLKIPIYNTFDPTPAGSTFMGLQGPIQADYDSTIDEVTRHNIQAESLFSAFNGIYMGLAILAAPSLLLSEFEPTRSN